MSKIIKFKSTKQYIDLKKYYPKPIKVNLPEWYKKLKHTPQNFTVKGCMPFLETLTTGYVLFLPQDLHLKHNIYSSDNATTLMEPSFQDSYEVIRENLNKKGKLDVHSITQIFKSPLAKKNLNLPVHKINNPWIIETPPGYSCLFVPPLNNSNDKFSIIPGIVNTDLYKQEINFPFVVNGDKYHVLDEILNAGTAYVQIIPFKRDSWEMTIEENNKDLNLFRINFIHKLINRYKEFTWEKSKWK